MATFTFGSRFDLVLGVVAALAGGCTSLVEEPSPSPTVDTPTEATATPQPTVAPTPTEAAGTPTALWETPTWPQEPTSTPAPTVTPTEMLEVSPTPSPTEGTPAETTPSPTEEPTPEITPPPVVFPYTGLVALDNPKGTCWIENIQYPEGFQGLVPIIFPDAEYFSQAWCLDEDRSLFGFTSGVRVQRVSCTELCYYNKEQNPDDPCDPEDKYWLAAWEGTGAGSCAIVYLDDEDQESEGDADGDNWRPDDDPADCDDTDPSVHPGADEVCDGKDTNCDGVIDNVVDDEGEEDNRCDDY